MTVTVNYWAVIVSAIVSMVIGSLWYGPIFGKKFMELKGMANMSNDKKAEMKKDMKMTYVWQFVANLVLFFVLAWYIGLSGKVGASGGMSNAFWVWIGFIVPLKLGEELWGGKMGLFWLGIGNMLVTLLAAGIIIGAW